MSFTEVGTPMRVAQTLSILLGHAPVLRFFWSGWTAWGRQSIATPRSWWVTDALHIEAAPRTRTQARDQNATVESNDAGIRDALGQLTGGD